MGGCASAPAPAVPPPAVPTPATTPPVVAAAAAPATKEPEPAKGAVTEARQGSFTQRVPSLTNRGADTAGRQTASPGIPPAGEGKSVVPVPPAVAAAAPPAVSVDEVKPPMARIVPPWVSQPVGGSDAGTGAAPDSPGGSSRSLANPVKEAVRANLLEIKSLLQRLNSVNSTPTIGLTEAAQLLCKHLNVARVSIIGITEGLASYILLAAHGVGAAELESHIVMKGADWSPYQLEGHSAHIYLTVPDDSAESLARLPKDWAALASGANMRSFLAVPIGTASETLGLLTICKEEVDAFADEWWEPMLGVLATGLTSQLRNEQVGYLCHLVRVLDNTTDYLEFIGMLLQGAHRMLLKTTNIKMGVRLGLLHTDGARALIFEVERSKLKADEDLTSTTNGRDILDDTHITEITLDNTLLLDAVNKGKARFVSDCASYLQSCMKPATDIFISGAAMVASIVVLPLVHGRQTLGGLYFTLETPSNFQNIKDLLMGFVNSVVLLLQQKLDGQLVALWDAIMQRPGIAADGQSINGSYMSQDGTGMGGGGSSMDVRDPVGRKVFTKRSCTEAMLKVLQHEIRKTGSQPQRLVWVEELALMETIGKGGFGVVYRGTWKGNVAAIKVMYARQHERQAMKDALEMAVLTTVSHPNIIQVYSCFTDMVEDAGANPAGSISGSGININPNPSTVSAVPPASPSSNMAAPEGRINVRFRQLQPEEDKSLATCNIVVMEFCDKGSLRYAMKRGVFHKRLGNMSVAVDLCAIVQVLLEVAQSVLHLHSMKLLHCDIKPENVLLKSEPNRPLGFITKLSDFGLAKLLRENYYIVNRSGSGTVTHLAPELFQVGSKITTAVDTFSFGIMMWELYTGQRAYSGLGRDAIIDRVYKKQARPAYPAGVPGLYANLSRSCWENDPHMRPNFHVIIAKLQEMLNAFQSGSYAGNDPAAVDRMGAAAGAAANANASARSVLTNGTAASQQAGQQQQQAGQMLQGAPMATAGAPGGVRM